MNLLKAVGVKKSVLPKMKHEMPRLSAMHGMKYGQIFGGSKRGRKKSKSVGKILRGV